MSFLTSDALVAAGGLTLNSTTQQHKLGERVSSSDGRAFRYCLAGGTTLVVGKLQQSPAQVANHLGLAVQAAAAIGATSAAVTLGATATTLNQYAEGFLVITATPGQGYTYKISGHAAASGSATQTLNLEDAIVIALTTSSTADLSLNPHSGVIVNPTTATGSPVGVAVAAVTNANFGWVQCHGSVACLNDAGTTVGLGVAPSAAVAGAVKTMAATLAQVGYALNTGNDTKYNAVYLTIS